MVYRIERRKRNRRPWTCVALAGCVLLSNVGHASARTWEVLVQPATYILLDHDMVRQIPEGDPVFTQTQLGTDAPTQMPVPTPSPVPLPTSAPSEAPSSIPTTTATPTISPAPITPTISPQPSVYVSYPPGEGPTMEPTPIYRNENINSLCPQSEVAQEIHMQDVFGDGWEGRNLTISVADNPHILSKATETQVGNSTIIKYKTTTLDGEDVYYSPGTQVWTGTLPTGAAGYDYTCIRPGVCYEAFMVGGAWEEEILWELKQPTYNVTPADNYAGIVIAKGGAPARCLFSIPDPLTGMTFCPTTCSRFPLDPTPFPSAAPTSSLMPSGIPSSSFPSAMPSLSPTSLYEPSDIPSLHPSVGPSNKPSTVPTGSEAPTVPGATPSPTQLPSSVPSEAPTSSEAPTGPVNGATPSLVDVSHAPIAVDNVAAPVPQPTRFRNRRTYQPAPTTKAPTYVDITDSQNHADVATVNVIRRTQSPTPGNAATTTTRLPTTTSTTTTRPPTTRAPTAAAASGKVTTGGGGVAYSRPVIHYGNGGNGNGGDYIRRPANSGGTQTRQYRNYGRNNNNNAGTPPPMSPAPVGSPSPIPKKETLDILDLGGGVR